MPEEASVMSTTFPATSSMKMNFMMDRRSLKNMYVDRKKTVRTMGGSAMFMIW
jgi:hypothetical protein